MRDDPKSATGVEVRLLGPLEARCGDDVLRLGGAKPRALLADLVLHLGEVVSVDRLIDDLWSEQPPKAAKHSVQVHLAHLRGQLGTVLVTRAPGYALVLDRTQVDSARFERLLAEAREAFAADDAGNTAVLLREALELWRGDAFADLAYEPFLQTEIARLEELRQEAVELRIDADLALGRADLVAELEARVAAQPLRERLHGQLMIALYRAGRQADALAVFETARTMLDEELGLEPSPELRALQRRILEQDPGLLQATPAPPSPQRKLATILFADVVDSTELAALLDPEALSEVLRRYFDAASAAIARHGGAVEKFVGDAVMAAFGTRVAHEDDALRGARAAVEILEAVAALDAELRRGLGIRLDVRLGLATGEVLAGAAASGDSLAAGQAVTLAARLQQAAGPGEIAVDSLTRRLTAAAGLYEPLGELPLRGLAEPVQAFRLVDLKAGAPAIERRLDAPLVGRKAELAALRRAFRQAVKGRTLQAVTVLGPAGIGKSRLAAELVGRLGREATFLPGRCLPYGESAYWPLREAIGSRESVVAALGDVADAEAVADRLVGALGAGEPGPAEEIPWAFRRLCEARAFMRPLVLVLDDLHWAQPALLDLLDHLSERSTDAPILLIGLAREELLLERGDLLGMADRIELEPLGEEETDAIAEHLLADTVLAPETRARLVEAAEGNPLFLEQLLSYAAETGSLDPPPTLRALLAARLDRLGPGERAVLERAAVVGVECSAGEVATLLEPAAVPTVGQHLAVLVRRGFLRAGVGGERFEFRHRLIQDAVYRGTPKQLRAELHERLADELGPGEAADELAGYHLEQAYRLRTELGPPDRHARRLAQDAGNRLGEAGLRVMKRSDVSTSSNLLTRATTLLPTADELRRRLLCELGVVLGTAGQPAPADQAFRDAVDAAVAAGDRSTELRARIELAARRVLTEPEGAASAFLHLAAESLPTLESLGDDRALGRTWMLTGWVQGGVHGQNGLWAEAARRALAYYDRSGWPAPTCIGQLVSALYFGPTPVGDAIAECEGLLTKLDDFAGQANVKAFLGGLEAMRGRIEPAGALVDESRRLFGELGQASGIARISAPISATVRLLAGDDEAAERELRESCDVLRRMNDRNPLATRAADLAEVILRQGRHDEAREWIEVAERNAASDDVDAQAQWRGLRAKVAARRGAIGDGEVLAREAVALADSTDALNRRARVRLDLAEVLWLHGRFDEATSVAAEGQALFEMKGNVVEAARAQVLWLDQARV